MSTPIKVLSRVRPLTAAEVARGEASIAEIIDSQRLVLGDVPFQFDAVFDGVCQNCDIYRSVSHLIGEVLEGKNGTVVAYGQTGSGKTYTMSGLGERAIYGVFDQLAGSCGWEARVSYLEIYNEQVRDLFDSTQMVRVRSGRDGLAQINNATSIQVTCALDALSCFKVGSEKRERAATECNAESSRSHAMFMLSVERNRKTGQLTLVDLAGSENAERTGECSVARRLEAKSINQSLLALGQVINKLAAGDPHVPFRDSMLTRLLQEPLSRSTAALVFCISPAKCAREESLSTLRYAERAARITTSSRIKFILPDSSPQIVLRLERDLDAVRTEMRLEASAAHLASSALAHAYFETDRDDYVETLKQLERLGGSRLRACELEAQKRSRYLVSSIEAEWALRLCAANVRAGNDAATLAFRAFHDSELVEAQRSMRRADFASAQHDLTLAQHEYAQLRHIIGHFQRDKIQAEAAIKHATDVIAKYAADAHNSAAKIDDMNKVLHLQQAHPNIAAAQVLAVQLALRRDEVAAGVAARAAMSDQDKRAALALAGRRVSELQMNMTSMSHKFEILRSEASARDDASIAAFAARAALCEHARFEHSDELAALEAAHEAALEAAFAASSKALEFSKCEALARHEALSAAFAAQAALCEQAEATHRDELAAVSAASAATLDAAYSASFNELEVSRCAARLRDDASTAALAAQAAMCERDRAVHRDELAAIEAACAAKVEAAHWASANDLETMRSTARERDNASRAALAAQAALCEHARATLRDELAALGAQNAALEAAHAVRAYELEKSRSEALLRIDAFSAAFAAQAALGAHARAAHRDELVALRAVHSAQLEAASAARADELAALRAAQTARLEAAHFASADDLAAADTAQAALHLNSRSKELAAGLAETMVAAARVREADCAAELAETRVAAARVREDDPAAGLVAQTALIHRVHRGEQCDLIADQAVLQETDKVEAARAAAKAQDEKAREIISGMQARTLQLEAKLRETVAELDLANCLVQRGDSVERELAQLKAQLRHKDEQKRSFSGVNQANTPTIAAFAGGKTPNKASGTVEPENRQIPATAKHAKNKSISRQGSLNATTDYRRKLRSSTRSQV